MMKKKDKKMENVLKPKVEGEIVGLRKERR